MKPASTADLIQTGRQLDCLDDVVAASQNPNIHMAFFTGHEIYFVGPGSQFKTLLDVPTYVRVSWDCQQWVNLNEGRTTTAAVLREKYGWTSEAAAKVFDINASNVRIEARKRRDRGVCPCCGRLLPKSPVPIAALPVAPAVGIAPQEPPDH